MMNFLRSLKVGTSLITLLLGAALLSAPLYGAVIPAEVQAIINLVLTNMLSLLLVGGLVLVAYNWAFDGWVWGNRIVSATNLLVGLAVMVVGVYLLVLHVQLGLFTEFFGPEAAGLVALVALGGGLADRNYVRMRYILTGKRAKPADERLALPTKDAVVEKIEEVEEKVVRTIPVLSSD